MIDAPEALTPARRLFQSTLARLSAAMPLSETTSADNGPWRTLISHAPFHQGTCGTVRIYSGPELSQIVTCSITAPAIGLDSHMLFAFARSDSAVPHFTVDCVQTGDLMAFHLDLLPRLDLATHLAYMDWAFAGLTEALTATSTMEGLTPAQITPRQRAVMSPWMIVNRATMQAFDALEPVVNTYLDHWLGLLATGTPTHVLNGATPQSLATRDKAARAIIFDPDVDKVWNQISGLIGSDCVLAIRDQLLQTSA
jgi:hypothetical protein